MTDTKQTFTHISVNDGSDDDIVIQAGTSTRSPKAAQAFAEEHLAEDASAKDSVAYLDEVEQVALENEDEGDEYEEVDVYEEADDEEDEDTDESTVVTSKKPDTYHETTLEDLQDTAMSSTQKVVIGVVLVILVVAIVYFAFFMK